MGGAIAQEMALAAPERVRTLTLAVTFASGGAWGAGAGAAGARACAKMPRERHVDELLLLNLSEELFEDAGEGRSSRAA